jgi:hypothetical protein
MGAIRAIALISLIPLIASSQLWQEANKPSSVFQPSPKKKTKRRIISLRPRLLEFSSSLPGTRNASALVARAAPRPLLGLAPSGVCRAVAVTSRRGGLLHHRFTLACAPCGVIGGLFSVALSVALPRPAVSRHSALWSSDFPRVDRHSRHSRSALASCQFSNIMVDEPWNIAGPAPKKNRAKQVSPASPVVTAGFSTICGPAPRSFRPVRRSCGRCPDPWPRPPAR